MEVIEKVYNEYFPEKRKASGSKYILERKKIDRLYSLDWEEDPWKAVTQVHIYSSTVKESISQMKVTLARPGLEAKHRILTEQVVKDLAPIAECLSKYEKIPEVREYNTEEWCMSDGRRRHMVDDTPARTTVRRAVKPPDSGARKRWWQ